MASFRVANHFVSLQNNGILCPHQKVIKPSLPYYSRTDNNPAPGSLKKARQTIKRLSKFQKYINRPIQKVHEQLIDSPTDIPSSSHLNPIPHWVDYAAVSDTTLPETLSTDSEEPENADEKTFEEQYQTLEELPKETIITVNSEGEKHVVLPFDSTKTTMKRYYGALPSPSQVPVLQLYVAFQDHEGEKKEVYWDGTLFPKSKPPPKYEVCARCETAEADRGMALFKKGEKLEGRQIVNKVAKGSKIRKCTSEFLERKRDTVRMVRNIEKVISLSGRNPWVEGSKEDQLILKPISAVPLRAKVLFKADSKGDED